MILNKIKQYSNILIALSTLLTINTIEITENRAIALDEGNIYIAQISQDRAEIEKLLNYSLKVYETEDIKGLMSLMHPNSPVKAQTEEVSKMAFSLYDLDYEYSNLEIINLSNTDATIQMTQTTKKINGSDFKDNRVTSIQTLKKHNGQWKFFDVLAIKDIEYLN